MKEIVVIDTAGHERTLKVHAAMSKITDLSNGATYQDSGELSDAGLSVWRLGGERKLGLS